MLEARQRQPNVILFLQFMSSRHELARHFVFLVPGRFERPATLLLSPLHRWKEEGVR